MMELQHVCKKYGYPFPLHEMIAGKTEYDIPPEQQLKGNNNNNNTNKESSKPSLSDIADTVTKIIDEDEKVSPLFDVLTKEDQKKEKINKQQQQQSLFRIDRNLETIAIWWTVQISMLIFIFVFAPLS